jgi:hypothetical protein
MFDEDMQRFLHFIVSDAPLVDLQRLEAYRRECVEEGLPTWATVSEIDHQIVTTPIMKRLLENMERLSEEDLHRAWS